MTSVFSKLPSSIRDNIFARAKGKSVCLPETEDTRVQAAAEVLVREFGVAVVLPTTKEIAAGREQTLKVLLEQSENRGKIKTQADFESVALDPFYYAGALLHNSEVHAVVGGATVPTSHVIRAALSSVGLQAHSKLITSAFLFSLREPTPGGESVLLYADCGVVPQPSSEQLSDIAYLSAKAFEAWTKTSSRVAFLSFSTAASAEHRDVSKVRAAFEMFQSKHPEIVSEGEVQFDAAVVPAVAERKNPSGKVRGRANVLIFPDLDAGNISYKVTQRIGGASAWGPVLLGTEKPFSDLSRGASADDIVHVSLLTLSMA